MIETHASSLKKLWEALMIPTGAVVLCHSYLPSIGRPLPDATIVIDTLIERLGPKGTLVVPTFTYSYFNKEVFNVETSPSKVGVLGELVRNLPGAIRSTDPNFSMAALGYSAEVLMQRENRQSLGAGSIYDSLMQADVKCLLLGVDFTALPLFMHLEKVHEVGYRYDKEFFGETVYRGNRFRDSAVHFVRDESSNPVSDRTKVGAKIDQSPQCCKAFYGYGMHRFVPGSVVANIVAESLAQDPYCLIEAPTGDSRGEQKA